MYAIRSYYGVEEFDAVADAIGLPGEFVAARCRRVETAEGGAQLGQLAVGLALPGYVVQFEHFLGGVVDLLPAVGAVLDDDDVGQRVDEVSSYNFV